MKKILLIVITFIFITINAQTAFTVFDFEGETMEPSLGTGTIVTIGGITTRYNLGWAGSAQGGQALSTLTYPAQGSNPESAGLRFQVSTVGRSNIHVSWNNYQSATSSSRIRLQYTIDGSTWINFEANNSNATNQRIFPSGSAAEIDFDNGLYVYAETNSWFNRTANLSDIAGVNNNPNFAVRLVSAYQSGTSQYTPVGTGNYAPGGVIRYDNVTFSHVDSNQVLSPIASPPGGRYTEPVTVTLTCPTPDATIYYKFDNSADLPVHTYTEPILISEYTILTFWGEKEGMTSSAFVTETYLLPIIVENLAELRTYAPGQGLMFYVLSEVFVTYVQEFRNQIFVQDDSAAILIDDFPGIITTEYQIGDGIIGLTGTLEEFGSMLQFWPTDDPGAPSSSGHTIVPTVITINQFTNNFSAYESRLVAFQSLYFTEPNGEFRIAQRYELSNGTATMYFRATFETDYLNTPIPNNTFDLIGILTQRSDGRYVTARFLDDFRPPTLSITDKPVSLENRLIGNFPNPFNPSTTIAFELISNTHVNIAVYNLRGQKIVTLLDDLRDAGSHTVNWNGIDENGLNVASGIYFYRLQTPENIQTKRAILMK